MSDAQELIGDREGITVAEMPDSYAVEFEFNRTLTNMMRGVNGATFSRDDQCWVVPKASADELAQAVWGMRKESAEDRLARETIEADARHVALRLQDELGAEEDVKPRISDYRKPGERYVGEIIASNSHYVAQFTGTGKLDGAAFVTLHKRSDLDVQLFNDDKAEITYDEKYRGHARKYLTNAEKEAKLDESLGASIDGVKVMKVDDKYIIEFDYNERLIGRIQKVDTAQFNRDANAWEVSARNKEYVAKAVQDMRQEFVADQREREALTATAQQKISGARVLDAFTKDGQAHVGVILEQSERYVMQHTGKDYCTLHRKAALQKEVRTDEKVRIEYKGGKGIPSERPQAKSNGRER